MKRTVWVGFVASEEQIGSFYVTGVRHAVGGGHGVVGVGSVPEVGHRKDLVKVAPENLNPLHNGVV